MKQHIVSNCYLKAWCDPSTPLEQEPYIWIISRDGSAKRKRAPHKSFTEADAFTIKFADGTKDLTIETTLGQLEKQFVGIRKRILNRRTLYPYDRAYLAAFMATMHTRTDPFANGLKQVFSDLGEMTEGVREYMRNTPRDEWPPSSVSPGQGVPISVADIEYMMTNSRPMAVESALTTAAPLMWNMNFAFLEAAADAFFVTSDNPCVWYDPESYKRPPFHRGAGLAMPKIEITMPISPEVLVLVSHRLISGYMRLSSEYTEELNRRTIAFSDEHFVSKTDHTLPIWFEPGTPPPDAWENRPEKQKRQSRNPLELQ